MTVRLRKWFDLTPIPGSPDPSVMYGKYHRVIEGPPQEVDPSDEGKEGKTYIVSLLSAKSSALLAPCPDFCEDREAPRLSKADKEKSEKRVAELVKLNKIYQELLKSIKK